MGMKRRHIMGMKQSKTGTQWAWNNQKQVHNGHETESFQMAIFTTHLQNVDCRHPSYCNQFVFLTLVTNITQRPKHATGLGQVICQVLETGSQTLRNETISGTNSAQWDHFWNKHCAMRILWNRQFQLSRKYNANWSKTKAANQSSVSGVDIQCWMIYSCFDIEWWMIY